MSEAYWQAKIWGLLHDPVFKPLHNNTETGGNSFWQKLKVMQNWVDNGLNQEESGGKLLKHILLAEYISSASDRAAIGSVTESINYSEKGLQISHLLSGAKLDLKIKQHSELLAYLEAKKEKLLEQISVAANKDIKRQFWWLWRCLPEATCEEFEDPSLLLMPAETRLPDSSIWSHASITAALAGALAGYDLTTAEFERWSSANTLSHPYLASFTFTPVQELIKASRKMRDFWAGSWILHYLCAKVCWKLALQYGPDSLLYPSLFQQPLIDHWLLQKFPEFKDWVKQPSDRALLTAGFPNVVVLVLPKDKVQAAMQTAKQTIKQAWQEIGDLVFAELHDQRRWMPDLKCDSSSWRGWLQSQWQFYWAAVPIGKEEELLKNTAIPQEREAEFQHWLEAQNQAYNLTTEERKLFQSAEIDFLIEAYKQSSEKQEFSVNVGSWWAHIFDQSRYTLTAVKNARNWQIPTAFGSRSTVSGIGPVVHPGDDWMSEGETKKYWERQAGLFDGREQLNATETVKRGLEKVLPKLLNLQNHEAIAVSYPDLTSGVAGYLKVCDRAHLEYYNQVCQAVQHSLLKTERVIPETNEKWGIPWIDDHEDSELRHYHPRLLNAGWLIEDLETREVLDIQKQIKALREEIQAGTDVVNLRQRQQPLERLQEDLTDIRNNYRLSIQQVLDRYYPQNNPADWYVLAAGDGDGMSQWLQGKNLKEYRDYIPSALSVSLETFQKFTEQQKRMGPSTHNALSRALLDFSNQLVPYLTERRYAGRLIYGGGDDVLAYTNLWEWDRWLWDIRQCFRGDEDPGKEFENKGNYWQCCKEATDISVAKRPLFTMGGTATISFGIVISHNSVPLAIALENLWEAEKKAKEHKCANGEQKDAVQVRVLYGNGNILKATAKFSVFNKWQELLNVNSEIDAAIFEQAANFWSQHPAPMIEAIAPWTQAFCDRREQLQGDESMRQQFQRYLGEFLVGLFDEPQRQGSALDGFPGLKQLPRREHREGRGDEVERWLKLAAFTIRTRNIKLGGGV